jgi:hypothetical protein
MSISIANCCPECADATLDYRVIDQVVNANTRTYTIQFSLNCVGINVAVAQTEITLSCSEEECIEVPLEFTWSGGSCSLTIFLGNTLTCICDPCGLPCDICVEFVTYNDEPPDFPFESDIGATIISSAPSPACTGQTFTVSFTILNNTGGVWQSIPDTDPFGPDFYLYFCLFSPLLADAGCTDLTYSGATPTPDRIPSATAVGPVDHFSCDWELNMANGASANYSVTFTVGSICDCSSIGAEATVARGYRKTATLACAPCEGGGGGGGGGPGPDPV